MRGAPLREGRIEMKQKLAILIVAAVGCLALPAQAQHGDAGDNAPHPPAAQGPTDPEARAEDLRLNGKCDEAIPILRDLADRGFGFEIARYNLGLCQIDLGKVEQDSQRAASLKHEGARNIVKAANGGFASAQLSLVSVYLDGDGVAADPVEAGKWSLIYHANSTRQVLGMPDVSADLQARLDGVLTAKTWADAQSRADAWSPTAQNSDGQY
jgi:hypothetical protein